MAKGLALAAVFGLLATTTWLVEAAAILGKLQGKQLPVTPDKIGQGILGGIVGGAIGAVAGGTTMTSSGGDVEVQDIVGQMWSGLLGGALAGFGMDGVQDELPAKNEDADRKKLAKNAGEKGMVAGAIGGSVVQLMSGSSDEGGSSASSSSSSPSSKQQDKEEARPNTSSGVSAQIPIIHNMVAGGAGASIVGYFEPEIVEFGGIVGTSVSNAAKQGKIALDAVKKKAEHMKQQAEQAKQQKQSALSEGTSVALGALEEASSRMIEIARAAAR